MKDKVESPTRPYPSKTRFSFNHFIFLSHARRKVSNQGSVCHPFHYFFSGAMGSCVYQKPVCGIFVESLVYGQKNKGLKIHAWCVMSNHVHLIVSITEPFKLSDVIRDLKKFTSRNIIQAIQENQKESRQRWMLWIFKSTGENNNRNEIYQFWNQENHPVECSTIEILESKMKYLHENPVRTRIVQEEGDYVYSSGMDYYKNRKGLLELDFV